MLGRKPQMAQQSRDCSWAGQQDAEAADGQGIRAQAGNMRLNTNNGTEANTYENMQSVYRL